MRNGRPFNQLALQFTPESPDLLPAGQTRVGVRLDIFNNLLVPTPRGAGVQEDFEEQRITFSWRKGNAGIGEAAIFVPIRYRNGGFLDEIMGVWHGLLGLRGRSRDNPYGRDALGSYHSILFYRDRVGNERLRLGNAFGLGDISATLKRPLIQANSRSALAGRIGLKLPTGNPGLLLGSGTFSAGLSLDGRYNLGPWWIAYANLGRVWSGGAMRVPGARNWINEYLLAAEFRPNGRDSWVLQLDGNSIVVETGNRRADESQATFTVGYQRLLSPASVMTISFSENGDWNDHTTSFFGGVGPDYTLTAGVTWRP